MEEAQSISIKYKVYYTIKLCDRFGVIAICPTTGNLGGQISMFFSKGTW